MVGEKILAEAAKQCTGMLKNYRREIDEAYLKVDGALSVGLKVNLSPNGSGVNVETEISFVLEKVKDKSYRRTVTEAQEELDFTPKWHPDERIKRHTLYMAYGDYAKGFKGEDWEWKE